MFIRCNHITLYTFFPYSTYILYHIYINELILLFVQLVALSGEEDIMSGGPPPVQQPKRFRNGHASFRLRMLQEQHGPASGTTTQSGSGFEPVSYVNKL